MHILYCVLVVVIPIYMSCFNCNKNRMINHAILHGVGSDCLFIMATMNLQPPVPFCFHNTDEWPKWEGWFEQYRQASELADKGDECQVSTLLHCLGDDAEDILDTTRITSENKKYSKVLDAFDDYFKVQKNIVFEWARFNKRCQLPNESVDQFITEVHCVGHNCEFGAMKEELIRDCLVVRIRDLALSE